ncbi:hypothetical protein ACP6JD_003478 [Aspergillus fumigatus]
MSILLHLNLTIHLIISHHHPGRLPDHARLRVHPLLPLRRDSRIRSALIQHAPALDFSGGRVRRLRAIAMRGGCRRALVQSAEEPRKEKGERTAQGGETGADDAEVGFDDGPHGRADAVPGGVEVVGGDVEGGDAQDGGDAGAAGQNISIQYQLSDAWTQGGNPQKTHGEYAAEGDLGLGRELQLQHDGDGQRDHDQVGEDVECGVGVPEGRHVDAGAAVWEGLVEGPLHRGALEDAGEDGADGEGDDDGDPHPAGPQEPLMDKQSDVQEENADLGQAEVDLVEDLGHEIELSL